MYQHILFATDLSENSKNITKKVAHLRESFGSKLSVIHVVEPIPTIVYHDFSHLEGQLLETAKKELKDMGVKLNIDESNQFVEFGSIKSKVVETAKAQNADLIVVGSHEREGLAKILGSSASAIFQSSECDVLVVRCE